MIDVPLALKIGLIGYRNQAERLIDIIKSRADSKLECIYHPTKKFDDSLFTNRFDDLLVCNAIIISSPNDTHYKYLTKLQNFDGYIFCEKPPVTSINELEKLRKNTESKYAKIFFNFNHRFSKFSNILRNKEIIEHLGIINHIQIISTHGLAFKKEYPTSWRADGTNNLHNILETVTIHYIDLLNYHFGKVKSKFYSPKLISKNGSSYDSCHLFLSYENGITASIFNSYASPLVNEICILGTNGSLNIRNNELTVSYPRDTFNAKGFFIAPPIKHRETFHVAEGYIDSLKESMNYFLNCVLQKTDIDKNHFESSIYTNQLIFEIENSVSI